MAYSQARELMNYSFLVVFADNNAITAEELHMMERLALKDDQIDEEEKYVLRAVFERLDKNLVKKKVLKEIKQFRKKYAI